MAVLNVINGPQDGLLKAARTMGERCIQYTEVVATVPRFQELAKGLNALIGRIDTAIMAKQSSRHTGNVTTEKNSRILNFMASLDDLANVIVDMAVEEKNSDWQNIATRALKSKTKAMSEEGLMAVASEFVAFLKTIGPKLMAHYGVEAAEITVMEEQIAEIKTLRVKKEVTVDQKSLDNNTLAGLFRELKNEKAKMERLSNRFAQKAPEFFAAFQKASVVTLKLGVKMARTKKDMTPEEEAAAQLKKAQSKSKKAKVILNRQPSSMGASSLTNGNSPNKLEASSATNGSTPASEAKAAYLVVGK
jgi:hypothetical protein